MKQLRFTTTDPGIFGTRGSEPFAAPNPGEEVIQSPVKGRTAYIHDDAERIAGYDIPIFLDGDMAQLDAPQQEQDILMVLKDNVTHAITAQLQPDGAYYLILKS